MGCKCCVLVGVFFFYFCNGLFDGVGDVNFCVVWFGWVNGEVKGEIDYGFVFGVEVGVDNNLLGGLIGMRSGKE